MIKIRDLQYLDALDRHKHFGRAADACYVSQPTLSGQLIKLEEQLSLKLIERHRRNVMLTPAGEQLVIEARNVLRAAEQFEDRARALLDPYAGDLHIGLIPTLAPYLLPHIMDDLHHCLPNINFYLHENKTHVLLKELNDGALDLLILPWLDEMHRFERYDLFNEPLVLTTPASHALAKRKTVTLEHLNGQTMLTLEDGHCLKDQAMGFCFSAGAEEDQRYQATSLETLRHMITSEMGITMLPKLATLTQHVGSNLAYLPFSKPEPSRQISLVIRPHYSRMDCIRQVASSIRASISKVLD